jgi:hypothetical protein
MAQKMLAKVMSDIRMEEVRIGDAKGETYGEIG